MSKRNVEDVRMTDEELREAIESARQCRRQQYQDSVACISQDAARCFPFTKFYQFRVIFGKSDCSQLIEIHIGDGQTDPLAKVLALDEGRNGGSVLFIDVDSTDLERIGEMFMHVSRILRNLEVSKEA
jgi:hypothetical protein